MKKIIQSLLHSKLIRWCLGLSLTLYLFSLIELDEFLKLLKGANAIYLILAALLFVLDRAVMGYKWNFLLKALGFDISNMECFRLYYASSFIGLFLPTSVGSDLVRLASLNVPGQRDRAAASMVVEKVLGMIAILVLVSLSTWLLIQHAHVGKWKYFLMALGSFVAMAAIFGYSFLLVPIERLQKMDGKWSKKLANLILAYHEFRHHKRALFLFFIVTFFEQLVPVMTTWFIALGFHLPGDFLTYLMVVPIVYIVARIPISVDGLGIMEVLYFTLLPLVGLTKTHALLIGVAGRVLNTLCMLPGGIFYAMGNSSRKKGVV